MIILQKTKEMKYQIKITDYIGSWTQRMVSEGLSQYQGKHVDILVSSYGGSVQAGMNIFRAIKDHGDVTVWFNGFVASAATFLAMGAKEVKMSKYSLLLIHKCMSTHFIWDDLNEEQIGQLIKDLQRQQGDQQKIDNIISYIYADRTGKDKDAILRMMSEARWLDKDECKDAGLVDSFFDGEPVAITEDMQNFFKYNNMPQLPDFVNEWAEDRCEESLLKRIQNLFAKNGKETNNEQPLNTFTMNKSRKSINEVLQVEGLECDEKQNATVSSDMLAKLDARISADATAIADKDKQIQDLTKELEDLKKAEQGLKDEKASLEQQVKDLKGKPAGESHQHVEEETCDDASAEYINTLSQFV